MNKTIKELLIFLFILIITIAIGYGIIKAIAGIKNFQDSDKKKDNELNIKWEIKLREVIKKQVEYDNRIIYDKKINEAIKVIDKRLVSSIDENPYNIEIDVIDSPVVNAAAFPGGYIIIYAGLIKISDSPEEIASVIAHELGHVIHRDSVKALKREFGLAVLLSILTGGDPNLIEEIIKNVISNKYSQAMEKNADDFAHKLLIKSGINPVHLADIFQKMKDQYDNGIETDLLKYFGTHPDIDKRINDAKKMSELFRGREEKFNIDWNEVKKSLPSVFD